MRTVTVACPGGISPPWLTASTWKVYEAPMPIAARPSKSRGCTTASSPVIGLRENNWLADWVLMRYVTLENRSASTACGKRSRNMSILKDKWYKCKKKKQGFHKSEDCVIFNFFLGSRDYPNHSLIRFHEIKPLRKAKVHRMKSQITKQI